MKLTANRSKTIRLASGNDKEQSFGSYEQSKNLSYHILATAIGNIYGREMGVKKIN